MKKYKRIICLLLVATLIISLSSKSHASETQTDIMERIAENTIQITTVETEYGYENTTFNNLNLFKETVQREHPEISNLDIAQFIMQYTQQTCTSMPDSEKLSFLEYDSITTSTTYIRIDNEGNSFTAPTDIVPYDVETSKDGYMMLTTNYSSPQNTSHGDYYIVWAYANWLKYPAIKNSDAFALASGGTFDNSYNDVGYVHETAKCNNCGKSTSKNRNVSSSKRTDSDLSLLYDKENYRPYLNFIAGPIRCQYCTGPTIKTSNETYLKYRIIITDNVNITSAYAYTTVGFSDSIDVSYTPGGGVSFSSSLTSKPNEYVARPLTILY